MMDTGLVPRLWLIFAALLFSTGGAAVKLASLAPVQVACVRSGLATVFLFVFVREARQRPKSSKPFLVALVFAATMLLFVLSSRATTAANAVFLQATGPLYVLVLGPLWLREPLARRDIVTLVGMGIGLTLFLTATGEASGTAPDPERGDLLAALSGATWALTILGLRWVGREGTGTILVAALGNAVVFLGTLPFAWPIDFAGAADVLVLVWLGCVQIGVAYLCVAKGIGRVPAFEASLLFLVEPVLSPVWAWLVHDEVPGDFAFLGGALILAAAVYSSWSARSAQST